MIHTTSLAVNELIMMFETLSDPRRGQGKRHPVSFAILIVMFATFSGYYGYRAIGDFIHKHRQELVTIFHPGKDRVPSFSTIRRILMMVSFDEFVCIYRQWLSKVQALSENATWMNMDGKTLCGTTSNHDETVHLVSIFSAFDQIAVDMAKVNAKSNEIPIVQQMIRNSQLTNVIFTLDALHCQKQTTTEIIDSGNDYVIAVKENQPGLYKQVQTNIYESNPIDIDYTLEKGHGRIEERAIYVYDNLKGIDPGWKGLQQLIQVDRTTKHTKSNQTTFQSQFYITSLNEDAQTLNQGIRGHWSIENKLHWVKDVVFKEDKSKISSGQAPQNISTIKNWVISIFKRKKYASATKTIRYVANDFDKMFNLLE